MTIQETIRKNEVFFNRIILIGIFGGGCLIIQNAKSKRGQLLTGAGLALPVIQSVSPQFFRVVQGNRQ